MTGPSIPQDPVASTAAELLSLQIPKDMQRCTICNETLNLPRPDGLTERATILPCSHVFGNLCILRWLETESLHQDCPNCRRRMVYRSCGHIIRPCVVEKAPQCVREEKDMPEKCAKCRGDGRGFEGLKEQEERRLAEEKALEGLRTCLPGVWGMLCTSTVPSIDERIEELRMEWRREIDAAFGELSEREGRSQW